MMNEVKYHLNRFPQKALKILVIDDEEAVRGLVTKILDRFGLVSLAAKNGEEAIAIFRKQADEIGCVLLDFSMPGMSCKKTLEMLKQIRPETPVLLVSGLSEKETFENCSAEQLAGFIQKPYRIMELIERIQLILAFKQ